MVPKDVTAIKATGICRSAWQSGNCNIFLMFKCCSDSLLLNIIFLSQVLILIWFKRSRNGLMTNLANFRQLFIKGNLVH